MYNNKKAQIYIYNCMIKVDSNDGHLTYWQYIWVFDSEKYSIILRLKKEWMVKS